MSGSRWNSNRGSVSSAHIVSRDRRWRGQGGGAEQVTEHGLAPGKRTLTQGLVGPSRGGSLDTPGKRTHTEQLQLRGGATTQPAVEAHALAGEGVASAGDRLPHAETIQRAFGHHDVTSVRTAVGGPAAEATRGLGAQAYAYGDRIAFGDAPDLHTAAHEAAHVVQQRSGVQGLAGGVGRAGDPHEQHADAVADAVVAGYSAVELLDRAGASSSGTGHAVVQRKEAPAPAGASTSVTALEFLDSDVHLDTRLERALELLSLTSTGPFGRFLGVSAFEQQLIAALVPRKGSRVEALRRLVSPESLVEIVDRSRGRDWEQPNEAAPPKQTNRGQVVWGFFESVVLEISNALGRRYNEAIQRVFPRVLGLYVEANPRAGFGHDVKVGDVVVSHPMDVHVAAALCGAQRAIKLAEAARALPGVAKLERVQQRAVVLTRSPKLWHWLDASPADATAEEVAVALFGKPEEAHRLIAMPPRWGFRATDVNAIVPTLRAQLLKEFYLSSAIVHGAGMPADLAHAYGMTPSNDAPESIDPVAELVAGAPRIGIERAQARSPQAPATAPKSPAPKRTGGTAAPVEHDEADVYDQLGAAIDALVPVGQQLPLFGLSAAPAHGAIGRLRYRREQTTKGSIANVEASYALAVEQRRLVTQISLGLAISAGKLVANGGAAAADTVRLPLRDVAVAFHDALVALELPELARPRVAQAEALAQVADIAILEAKLHEGLPAIENAKATDRVGAADYDAFTAGDRTRNHLEELALSRRKMLAKPDEARKDVDKRAGKVDELEFEIGIGDKLAALDQMWSALSQMDDAWSSTATAVGDAALRGANRALYETFKTTVFDPFREAEQAEHSGNAEAIAKAKLTMQAARDAFAGLLRGKAFQVHARQVADFLRRAAREKKWTKIVVGLGVAFAAFGLGQWGFAAMIADGAGVFEAAMVGGLITTASSAALEKAIFQHDPTAGGLISGLATNITILGVVGKLALAAKAAGVEASVLRATAGELEAESVLAHVAGSTDAAAAGAKATKGVDAAAQATKVAVRAAVYGSGLIKEAMIAEALGLVQGEVASLIDQGRTLSTEEVSEMFAQQLIGVIGMRAGQHLADATLGAFKHSGHRALDAEIEWLITEQAHLEVTSKHLWDQARAHGPAHVVVDRAAALEFLGRWRVLLERERIAREKILAYADKHPGKYNPEAVEKLRARRPDAAAESELARSQALLGVEQTGPNQYRCDHGALDVVLAQHRSLGNEITRVETDPHTGQRKLTIKPVDGSPAFQLTEALPPKGMRTEMRVPASQTGPFEAWLDQHARDPGLAEVRRLYASDPQAAIELAAARHGYVPHEAPAPEPMVHGDAAKPAHPAARTKAAPSASVTGGRELAAAIGEHVTAIADDRFVAPASDVRHLHGDWKRAHGHAPSKIHYDAATNSVHFEAELEVAGKRTKVRVQADLGPRIDSYDQLGVGQNRVIGHPVSLADGHQILRDLNAGKPEALKRVGITGEKRMPGKRETEFGVGELSEGGALVVCGEPAAVDWGGLPGLEPRGHTHPEPTAKLPDKVASVRDVTSPSRGARIDRAIIFPSAADIIVMAKLGVKSHTVQTAFTVDGDTIRRASGAEPRLEITILNAVELGLTKAGERVFHTTLVGGDAVGGIAGVDANAGREVFRAETWVVESLGSVDNSGHHYMAEPKDLIRRSNTVKDKGSIP